MKKEPAMKDKARNARKPYASPRLHVHGDAAELTRSLLRLSWTRGKGFDLSGPG